jgi:integrase
VNTVRGIQSVAPTIHASPFDTQSTWPARITPFIAVASAIMCSIPAASAAALEHSTRIFCDFVAWAGTSILLPAVEVLVAFIVCRCVPPVGVELPPTGFKTPVLPTTAVGNVDALRRAARKGVACIRHWLPVLESDVLAAFCAQIGGRVQKLRSSKRPFLFAKVQEAWDRWSKGSLSDRRNACIVVLGFFFGCRAGELAAFTQKDMVVLPNGTVRLTFRTRKNRQTILGTHDPQVIHAKHPLLTKAMTMWKEECARPSLGLTQSSPLFFITRAAGPCEPLSKASFRALVKRIDPECVAHSLRVGMATEAWAAGVPIESIMALGGWTSPVAILYIIGSMDETIVASSKLGSAKMRFDADGLRAQLGTARLPPTTDAII